MGEARAKAAGEIGGPIRCGRKVGVSKAAPKGWAVPDADWGKGPSKGVVAVIVEGEGSEGWLRVARGHWGTTEQGGGRAGSECPKAAVTFKPEDTGSAAGGEKQNGIKGREEKKRAAY